MGLTITYKEDTKGWVSFKSFIPEYGMSMSNNYFTFKDGEIYQHHVEGTAANAFYTPQTVTPSHIDVLLNDSSDVIKRYNTINYEGSQSRILGNAKNYYDINYKAGWFVESIVTDEGRDNEQHGKVPEFIEKEGKWFNYIKGAKSEWNSFQDYNLDSSEFSFQGLGNMITQPSTPLPPISPQLFTVLDSQDVDTIPFASPWLTLTNPLSTGQEDGILSGLISTFGAFNMPYYFEDPYANFLSGVSAFEYVLNTTNLNGNVGYATYSNANIVISEGMVSGYQTITLVTGSEIDNPEGVVGAFNLRINGHTLGDLGDTFVIPNTPPTTVNGTFNYGGVSNYASHSSNTYYNFSLWAPLEDVGFETYTIQNPAYDPGVSGYVHQYIVGPNNFPINVWKIVVEEDYVTHGYHDDVGVIGGSNGGFLFPGAIHIKVYFEDFEMPSDNLSLPIDIDSSAPEQVVNLNIHAHFGDIATMALDQYYNDGINPGTTALTAPNFTIDGYNANTGFSSQTITSTDGATITDEIEFIIRPVNTYTIGVNASSNVTTGVGTDGNEWGEACDNLTNQSVWLYGISCGGTNAGGYPSPYDNVGPLYIGSWLSGFDTTISTNEKIVIDQTGANNYNVNSNHVAGFSNSLSKISEIEVEEWYVGYSGTLTAPPAGAFPDWIIVKVKLNFTMPANDVDLFVPIQHNIENQISSLPASPWEWGCTDPAATNTAVFGSGTPVNNGSCYIAGVSYDIYIHYLNGQFTNNGTSTFSYFNYVTSSYGARVVIAQGNFSGGAFGGNGQSDKYTCASGTTVSTTYPNGWIKILTTTLTQLWANSNQNYPMGSSSDMAVAGTILAFADDGDDNGGVVPNWFDHTHYLYQLNTLTYRASNYLSTNIPFMSQNPSPTTKRTIDISSGPGWLTSTAISWGRASNYHSALQQIPITGGSVLVANPPTYSDSLSKIGSIDVEEVYPGNSVPNGNPTFPTQLRLTIHPDFIMPNSDVHIYIPIDQDITPFHQDVTNP